MNAVTVAFITEHGDLPDLSADTSQLFDSNFGDEIGGGYVVFFVDGAAAASDSSLVSVTGTTESLECSGRGLCERSTGECECFPGYGSSDGVGGAGKQDDCTVRGVPILHTPQTRLTSYNTQVGTGKLFAPTHGVAGSKNASQMYFPQRERNDPESMHFLRSPATAFRGRRAPLALLADCAQSPL